MYPARWAQADRRAGPAPAVALVAKVEADRPAAASGCPGARSGQRREGNRQGGPFHSAGVRLGGRRSVLNLYLINRQNCILRPISSEFFFETHPARAPMQREITGDIVSIVGIGCYDSAVDREERAPARPRAVEPNFDPDGGT